MITSNSLLHHELIGLKIEITESNQNKVVGLTGKVIFESKNILHIRDKESVPDKKSNSIKKIPKEVIKKMKVILPQDVCFISGLSIIGRPEDRLSKK